MLKHFSSLFLLLTPPLRLISRIEQPLPTAAAPASTSCRKKKTEGATFLEDVKDHIHEFINTSMEEHKNCFKNTMQKEKIMRVPYGPNKEFFKYSLFLVFCNRIMTFVISAVTLLASKKALDPVAPVYKYFVISVSNILTTTCQYEALKYVSFPVQTLAKCAKMVPVMEKADDLRKKKQKKKKQMEEENVNEVISEVRNPSDKDIDSEEDDFWMPPLGERWDFDDGGDRWGSGSESRPETDDASEPGLGHSSSGWFGSSFCFWTGRSCCLCHWEWFGIIFYCYCPSVRSILEDDSDISVN